MIIYRYYVLVHIQIHINTFDDFDKCLTKPNICLKKDTMRVSPTKARLYKELDIKLLLISTRNAVPRCSWMILSQLY